MRRALAVVPVLVLMVSGCANANPEQGPESSGTPTGSGTPTDSSTAASAAVSQELFLARTAAHVCQVQGTVYPDQEALQAAYASLPDYADLDSDRVAALTKRLRTDPELARLLNEQITRECGTG